MKRILNQKLWKVSNRFARMVAWAFYGRGREASG